MFTRLFTTDQPAPAQSSGSGLDQVRSSVSRLFGLGGEESKPTPAPKTAAAALPHPAKPAATVRPAAAPAPATASPSGASDKPPAKATAQAQASEPEIRTSAASPDVMAGAQPVLPSGSFENRWGGLR